MKTYTYTFDQLRFDNDNAYRLFANYERTVSRFGGVDISKYFTAHYGTVDAENETDACEKLFCLYNADERPSGYSGRSMSVSDIVNLWDNSADTSVKTTWFCDSVGFKRLD